MKNKIDRGGRAASARASMVFALAAAAVALAAPWQIAAAAEPSLSDDTAACLKCHDKPDLAKRTADGKPWSLHVSSGAYLKSRHATNDCTDCHEDITDDAHAKAKSAVASRRDFALTLNEACTSCHKKKVAQYQDSVHATLVKEGSKEAPLCSDCHAVHTLQSVKIAVPVAETPCLKCHAEIGKAYVGDVHGLKRVAGVEGERAPLCADCHQSHAIRTASFDARLKDTCLGCHEDAFARHKDWLPNAGRHFEAISCPVCHAPAAERRVSLRLFERRGDGQFVQTVGVPRFETRTQKTGDSGRALDENALLSLLEAYGRDEERGDVVLHGRLEVRSGAQAHQLAEKSKAIRDCDTCHRQGAQAFQSVVLTVAGADGRPLRQGVDARVLNSLTAMDSVRGFYAIGATRIKLLDWLLVLVVLGSVGGVLGHMTMKWATRRMRERGAVRPPAP